MSDPETPREGDGEQVGAEVAPTGDAAQAGSEPPTDVEQARREVEQTRAEMGDTVEALSQKADLKAQYRQRMEERKATLRRRQDELKAKARQARGRASGATPDDAKRTASQLAQTAEQRPFPAIGVAFGAGLLLGWLIARD